MNMKRARIFAASLVALAIALAASAQEARPPKEEGEFRRPELVELNRLDRSLRLDVRYATANNFVGKVLSGYEAEECVVKRDVALRLKAVQQELAKQKL
ncbi:MAG TPA: M15 family metallopeptidase, partial [Pyrinomonadaceae bacterium]|nr:M15 family metallopeptidase [Pyrinomonadaceae bacterium]